MYIHKFNIRNIRSIEVLEWEMPIDQCAGWHVFIGDNASGKSTVLRSLSLALVGPENAFALRQNWNDWLKKGKMEGGVQVSLKADELLDKFTEPALTANTDLRAVINLIQEEDDVRLESVLEASQPPTSRHVWGKGQGWFSAAYGPFRRFTGGNPEYARLVISHPKLVAHLSIFGEDVALSETIEWLKRLNYKTLENDSEGSLLEPVKKFINQPSFLPHQSKLVLISSNSVIFEDGNGNQVTVENLSDGFRSILSMTFELIRQLQLTYPGVNLFSEDYTQVIIPGVVLIDEIDVHLHPTWQKRVGLWFRQHFPNMQFMVTTHSPLVCQAADKGSVWKLPAPGTKEVCKRVSGQELNRLLYGNILEAYSTQLFGIANTRSELSREKLEHLAQLNIKEVFEGLTPEEHQTQLELRAMLPTQTNEVKK